MGTVMRWGGGDGDVISILPKRRGIGTVVGPRER